MTATAAAPDTPVVRRVPITRGYRFELVKLLSSAFENHQAVMLQTPWPEQMLSSFEATRRFLEGAAQGPAPTPAEPAE